MSAVQPSNARKRWTPEEEAGLAAAFAAGRTLQELAQAHGRSPYAVRLRLIRLGVLDEHDKVLSSAPVPAVKPVHRRRNGKTLRRQVRATGPRLTLELVPSSSWYSNVRSEVSASEWQALRLPLIAAANNRCEICDSNGAGKPLECHEIWRYDDDAWTQTLDRMIVLCDACHEVKHFGHAAVNGRGEAAEAHLRAVNGWSHEEASDYLHQAFATWKARSTHDWTVDLAALGRYKVAMPVSRPKTRVITPSQTLTTVVAQLPNFGKAIPQAAGIGAMLTVVVASLARALSSTPRSLPERAQEVSPQPFDAAPPAMHADRPQWEREGAWRFYWDGQAWTGDRVPVTRWSGWWPDPYGTGIRWWNGHRWSRTKFVGSQGWVQVSRFSARRYVWWNGECFDRSVRIFAKGTPVRPLDRKNRGHVIGIDYNSRDKPVRVHFRNRQTGREAVVGFPMSALRRASRS